MTTPTKLKSSFGSVVFTTNIPGDKEHTLNPNQISYSDNLDFKLINATNKLYYYNEKIINKNFFSDKTRSSALNILFNKNRFDKIKENNFSRNDFDAHTDKDKNKKEIVSSNLMSYLENLFTTFPKSNNVKKTSKINEFGGLKLDLPYTNVPYTYLEINGVPHTVSRVLYYDDKKDSSTLDILNDYNEFEKWYDNKNVEKVFTAPVENDFKKLFDNNTTKNNLYNTFGNKGVDSKTTLGIYKKNIEHIRKFLDSNEIPSGSWSVQQFNDYFFGNKPDPLFGDESKIMKKINEKEITEITAITTLIGNFKKKVSEQGILVKGSASIILNKKSKLTEFVELVRNLLQEIEPKLNVPKKLWIDLEWTEDPDVKKPNTETTTSELERLQKSYEAKQELYELYNKDGEGSLLITKIMINIRDYSNKGTIETARIDEEISSFNQAIQIIFEKYQKLNLIQGEKLKDLNNAYNLSRILSEQFKQIKKPFALNSSLFPSYKFKDIIELLDSFMIHYELYSSLKNKMYNVELLNAKYSKYNEYKQYIDFVKKINQIYEHREDFELEDIEKKINNGELIKIRKDSGFENEYIRLHIDLIKGKVNDEVAKKIDCEYKDNDLVERWNKLDMIKDDSDEIEHMHYFNVGNKEDNTSKTTAKGGKSRRKRTRKRRSIANKCSRKR